MRVVLAFLSGWVLVTLIFSAGLFIETGRMPGRLVFIVGVIVGIYVFTLGVPAYLLTKGVNARSPVQYIIAGLAASVPMAVFCLYQREYMYLVITLIAGVAFGAMFTWEHRRRAADT